ncbi:DUF2513 domain-containing protein [Opitutus terrae]|nr:DUF2513 domain-containing protein [Opitutus terrae]
MGKEFMKRDMDLVRKLLFFFEEKESPRHVAIPPIEGYDDRTIKTHLVLLHDAGLLRCEPVRSRSSERVIYVLPFELTWAGHDFVQTMRSDTLWKKAKTHVLKPGASWSFEILKEWAKQEIKEKLGMSGSS